jgi:hypothetical protein
MADVKAANPFALLNDDEEIDDPEIAVQIARKAAEKKKADAEAAKKKAALADKKKAAAPAPAPAPATSAARGRGGASRGGARNGGDSRAPRTRDFEGNDGSHDDRRGGRGGSRGARGGARGEGRPPRDDLDRHSRRVKSSVRSEEKREGAGKFNWGSESDAAAAVTAEAGASASADETDAGTADATEATETEAAEPAVEESKEITLAEYRKRKAENAPKRDLPAPRKAGEGDNKKWVGVQYVKEEPEGYLGMALMSEDKATAVASSQKKKQQAAHKKQQLDKSLLNFRMADPEREERRGPREGSSGGRGGARGGSGASRGGRGGGRGGSAAGGGGGGARGARGDSSAVPKINDQKDFPGLGAK